MIGNPYGSIFSTQPNVDRINDQIAQLEAMKKHIQQQPQVTPTNLTQNFQLTPPSREIVKYAGSMDEVQRETVVGDTPYFSPDMTVVWIKNTRGEIKTYELTEIVPKDQKDIKIELLQAQLEELRKEIKNESITNDTNADKSEEPGDIQPSTKPNKKSK